MISGSSEALGYWREGRPGFGLRALLGGARRAAGSTPSTAANSTIRRTVSRVLDASSIRRTCWSDRPASPASSS